MKRPLILSLVLLVSGDASAQITSRGSCEDHLTAGCLWGSEGSDGRPSHNGDSTSLQPTCEDGWALVAVGSTPYCARDLKAVEWK